MGEAHLGLLCDPYVSFSAVSRRPRPLRRHNQRMLRPQMACGVRAGALISAGPFIVLTLGCSGFLM